ncbi:MAG: CBS domain-containing protein [Thermoplasmata archaeon]|nr:MAG: CBS domain-containing protein [Thermoplasmata archaeon]
MKVKEIMTKEVICVSKNEDLRHVMDLMEKNNITKIPVVEDGKVIGVVTDNKMADKFGSVKSKGVPVERMHASTIMERNFIAINPETDLKEILTTVGKPGLTMLLVIENDKLVGVVTKADLLPLVKGCKKVKEVMTQEVFTVRPYERVIHARRIMLDNNIARIPVVDEGKVIGMLSDKEIAFAFAEVKKSFPLGHQHHHVRELLVEDVMKIPAITIKEDESIEDATKKMMEYEIGCLPVVDDEGKLKGIITRTDLVKLLQDS